jgi:hypothetical protein
VALGRAFLADADGCVAWAEGGSVVAWGVEDLVVVHRPGVTLVMPRERAPELKELLARLPEDIVGEEGGGESDG